MSELNPMDEKVQLFLEERDEALAGLYPFDSNKRGKWMLFYKREYMNKMWKLAQSLYRTGELTGIISIKCSTAASNPRATAFSDGAIRFACGPYDDEKLVLSYGKNLTEKMQYFSERGHVAYKTDEQTAKGTRATGAKRNFFYRIPVPTVDHLATGSDLYNTLGISAEATQQEITKAYRRTALKVHPDKNKDDPTAEEKFKQLGAAYETLSDQQKRANYDRNKSSSSKRVIEMPCRTYTKEWLSEIDDDIALQYYMELGLLGKWTLIFKKHELDAALSKACRLYRDNKLTGISFMTVTTVKKIRVERNVSTGIIMFYCGPHDNEELVQSYGRNLCKEMSYECFRGTVDFKVGRKDQPAQTLYRINI